MGKFLLEIFTDSIKAIGLILSLILGGICYIVGNSIAIYRVLIEPLIR